MQHILALGVGGGEGEDEVLQQDQDPDPDPALVGALGSGFPVPQHHFELPDGVVRRSAGHMALLRARRQFIAAECRIQQAKDDLHGSLSNA